MAIVGAIASNEAFIFERQGASWRRAAEFEPTSGIDDEDPSFSEAVAIDGDVAVVGAPDANGKTGEIYIIERSGATWSQTSRIESPGGEVRGRFGSALAVSEGRIAVGAGGTGRGMPGTVIVFERDGGEWAETGRLRSPIRPDELDPDVNQNDGFGSRLAIDGNTLAVGSASTLPGQGDRQSVVLVYEWDGVNWGEPARVVPDRRGNGAFGGWIALSGPNMAVSTFGFPFADREEGGAVHAFRRQPDGSWHQEAEIPTPRLGPEDEGRLTPGFGFTADASGDRIAASAVYKRNHGLVYTYVRQPDGTWTDEATVERTSPGDGDFFGDAVALDRQTLIVGAPGANRERGGTYVFERQANNWVQTQ